MKNVKVQERNRGERKIEEMGSKCDQANLWESQERIGQLANDFIPTLMELGIAPAKHVISRAENKVFDK